VPVTNDLLIEEIVQQFSNDFAHDSFSVDDEYKYHNRRPRPRQVYRYHSKGKPVQQLYTGSLLWGGQERPSETTGKRDFWVPKWPQISTITKLPEDVMIHALLYLDEPTLWRISRTCKLFKSSYFRQVGQGKIESRRILFFAAQGYRFPKLRRLKIEKLHFPTCNILLNEFFFPSLREVELDKCFLPNFCKHSKVEKLRVTGQFHTDMLSFYPNIKRLCITRISNIELGHVVHLFPKCLQRLTIDVATVKPADWEVLGQLTELELLSLWIGQNKDIKRDELVHIEIPPTLVKLKVILIRGLESTPVIPPLPVLNVLTLEKINDIDISQLPTLPSLKTLELYRCRMDFWDVHLLESKYPNLQVLLLWSAEYEMILNLDLLPYLETLQELTLGDVDVVMGPHDKSRKFFPSKTPNLVKLTLDHVVVSTPLLNSLKKSGDIRRVTFKACRFRTPFKLPLLVGIRELVFRQCEPLRLEELASTRWVINKKLESLTIVHCRMNDACLRHLKKFPNLFKLDLSENSLRVRNIPHLHQVERLTMVSCHLNQWDVQRLLVVFPYLKAMDLSKNEALCKEIARKHNSGSIKFLSRYYIPRDLD